MTQIDAAHVKPRALALAVMQLLYKTRLSPPGRGPSLLPRLNRNRQPVAALQLFIRTPDLLSRQPPVNHAPLPRLPILSFV